MWLVMAGVSIVCLFMSYREVRRFVMAVIMTIILCILYVVIYIPRRIMERL